jgi:hypothetical protein
MPELIIHYKFDHHIPYLIYINDGPPYSYCKDLEELKQEIERILTMIKNGEEL